jgi:hypothetical protein
MQSALKTLVTHATPVEAQEGLETLQIYVKNLVLFPVRNNEQCN